MLRYICRKKNVTQWLSCWFVSVFVCWFVCLSALDLHIYSYIMCKLLTQWLFRLFVRLFVISGSALLRQFTLIFKLCAVAVLSLVAVICSGSFCTATNVQAIYVIAVLVGFFFWICIGTVTFVSYVCKETKPTRG